MLTIPVTVVTMGLFLIVISTLCVMMAGYIITGFVVSTFSSALLFAIIYGVMKLIITPSKKEKR